jgi:hypothetical protein
MKKFKQILNKLSESIGDGGSVFNGFSDAPRRSAFGDQEFGFNINNAGSSVSKINAFIHKFLSGEYLEPEGAIRELRSRLNHAGLDFVFSKKTELHPGQNAFPIKLYGDVFGATPSTDLSKGFNRGEDLPKMFLLVDINYNEATCMYSMNGRLSMAAPATKNPLGEEMMKAPEKKRALSMKEKAKKISKIDEKVEQISEEQDPARKVMHFIMRNNDMKTKVLKPVYNHLKQKKTKGKLSLDDARKELYFVVNTAMRKMNASDNKVSLSQKDKSRVVNDLVRNFKSDLK